MNDECFVHLQHLDATLGSDWNTPKARVYIVARLADYDKALRKQSEELIFEKAVNQRSTELVKSIISETLKAISKNETT